MLKIGEPNPLNIFGLRQLTHCPPHFVPVSFQLDTTSKAITDWIYENLEGRFYMGTLTTKDSNNKMFLQNVVAFESPGEASYFSLFLDQINKPKWVI